MIDFHYFEQVNYYFYLSWAFLKENYELIYMFVIFLLLFIILLQLRIINRQKYEMKIMKIVLNYFDIDMPCIRIVSKILSNVKEFKAIKNIDNRRAYLKVLISKEVTPDTMRQVIPRADRIKKYYEF